MNSDMKYLYFTMFGWTNPTPTIYSLNSDCILFLASFELFFTQVALLACLAPSIKIVSTVPYPPLPSL